MFWMKKTLIRGAIKEHAHNMHEFLVCLSGGLLIEDSLATYTLKQGSAIFIPCNMVHKITIFDGESACSEVLLACIKPATLDLMRSPCNNDFIEKLKQETTLSHSNNDQGDNLERCIQEVDALSMSPSLLNQSFAENCFIKCCFYIWRGCIKTQLFLKSVSIILITLLHGSDGIMSKISI
ncbi:hypothetical protein A3743_14305 [Oleiphilus sp. HI0072]|nr:hypothetical protein A3743_14305 [Oleiphilus sp. HI0072]